MIAPVWQAWINDAWPDLVRHGRAVAPPGMPLLEESGFDRPYTAERAGQVSDWTISVADGSRVHVQEYPDGAIVAHRDEWDPKQGLVSAAKHVVFETVLGRFAALTAVGLGVALVASRLGFGFTYIPISKVMPKVGL